MNAEGRCEQVRALAPELALGIAEGEERAFALEHLTECPDCGRYLGQLSETADRLLLLAPAEEPPVGFETRVLARIRPEPKPRRRLSPLRAAVALAGTAAIAVAATLNFAYRGDRDLASRYRNTLAEAHGRYLSAEKLAAPGGDQAGVAFGYDGDPSWVLVTLEYAEMGAHSYRVQLVTDAGRRVPIGSIQLQHGTGSLGRSIPVPFHRVAEVRLLGDKPGDVYEARFEHG